MMRNEHLNHKIFLNFFLAVLVIFVSSCVKGEKSPLIPSPTQTIFAPSNTPIPTSTSTPIPPTPTITQTSSPTVSPQPTLDYTESQDYLIELIKNPGDCRLPCFLGFTPAVTPWQDVLNLMVHIGYGEIEPLYSYDLNEPIALDSGFIDQNLMMKKSNDLVDQIWFYSESVNEPQRFVSLWDSYSPMKILAVYGKPSAVYFSISPMHGNAPTGNNIREGYSMWLIYNPQGFLLKYDGSGKAQNGNIRICPHLGQDGIEWIWLYTKEPVDSNRMEITSGYGPDTSQAKTLEKATGLSLDQFMGLATGAINCLDTPYSIWP